MFPAAPSPVPAPGVIQWSGYLIPGGFGRDGDDDSGDIMKSKNMHCTNNKLRETKINKETSTNQPILPLSAYNYHTKKVERMRSRFSTR